MKVPRPNALISMGCGAILTAALAASGAAPSNQQTSPPPTQAVLLSNGRVQVTVQWQNPYSGQSGIAYALPQTDQFAFFYYSDPTDPEVFVKVLDFGSGSALCFVGGLTDFYYKVTFTVVLTGQQLVFEKPAYKYIGFVDASTLKFPTATSIAAISVCESEPGPGTGCVDSHKLVLGSDGSVINDDGVHGISDEHATILPPGAAGDNKDYLLFVGSGTSANPDIGVVALTLGSGPDASGQWTANFAPGYGDYGAAGFGAVFLAPTAQGRCPTATSAAAQDQTFDLQYASAGSILVDPTQPSGHLLMFYEGANGCFGTTGGTAPPTGSYMSAGIATSRDGGRTWPTYRATPSFGFVDLPKASKTQGPGAPFGETGGAVCEGNDCTAALSPAEGRYAVLMVPTTLDSLMKASQPPAGGLGDSEPSAFVDDVAAGPGSAPWVYAVHQYIPGDSSLADGRSSTLSLARARLNGGTSTLSFAKWDGTAFRTPGLGGTEAPILPDGSFAACGAPAQARSQGSISFVDDTRQYVLFFVCSSPGDPAKGPGTGHGSAWFWSTSDDLSDPSRWTTPEEVAGTWQVWDTGTPPGSYGCPSYEGWYPSLMSLGRAPGHLSTSGFVFYLWGCLGGSNANPPKRQYSSRRFTISAAPAPAPGGASLSLPPKR